MMKLSSNDLIRSVKSIEPWAVSLRRDIHAHPELGGNEKRTSALVRRALEEMGIPYTTYPDYTGVVGLIEGGSPGPVIGLRADMDALPIQEADKSKPYCSQYDGVMHACGHDAHTAILLGTARVLSEIKEQLNGSVKLIFQPSEECSEGGATAMVALGCLESPHVDEIYGIHVDDQRDVGYVGTRIGVTNTSSDGMVFTVRGKSAHGTRPELGADAVYAACQAVCALHGMLSRKVGALENVSLNIGVIRGGTAANIIADTAVFELSLRTTNPDIRSALIEDIERTVEHICAANHTSVECKRRIGCASVVNDKECVELVKSVSDALLGKGRFTFTPNLCMGSEDFSAFTQHIPSCLYDIGIRNREKGIESPLHNRNFDMDEAAIGIGILMQSGLVAKKLGAIKL